MKIVAEILLALLMLGFVQEAASAPISYSFSGALTDIRDGGAGFVFGASFVGAYIHDDAPQSGLLIEVGRELYFGGQFGMSVATNSLVGNAVSELQVFNNWTNTIGGYDQDDGYFVSSRVYDANGIDFYLIQFDLWDFTGYALTSLEMPTHSQLTALAANGRAWIRRFEGGTETGLASGNFGAMFSRSVAEPTTLLLSLISIVGLVGFAVNAQARPIPPVDAMPHSKR